MKLKEIFDWFADRPIHFCALSLSASVMFICMAACVFFISSCSAKHDEHYYNWGASEHPGEWIMVFTEHHGFHVYPVDDLSWFQEMQFVNSERFFATLEDMVDYKTKHPDYQQNEETAFCRCGEDIVFNKKENAEFCQTCGKEISGTRHPPKRTLEHAADPRK